MKKDWPDLEKQVALKKYLSLDLYTFFSKPHFDKQCKPRSDAAFCSI